jgi:hypothetical protein
MSIEFKKENYNQYDYSSEFEKSLDKNGYNFCELSIRDGIVSTDGKFEEENSIYFSVDVFAKHRHNGLDEVKLSAFEYQYYKDGHRENLTEKEIEQLLDILIFE